ncbi:MAG TPA: MFS transporter [Segeticoccus sp.]|uniref:MFS transporter n=1 Tax=Segeticoccus sp. TaxID=2706531 RepID=UPI002D7EBB41|nr:MFS transporter [Segeticoccus sp.]HET8600508.1 MFS transporter [Segeticoccus sp.]
MVRLSRRRGSVPQRTPILRVAGMPALTAMTFVGFAGYAVLLPVAPLWAVHGGADSAGAGLVNGVLLLFTVLTQLFVPPALRRFGWGPVLSAGMVLLGVPSVLYAVSDALAPVLALSAVRGVGFGVLTVTGSAAIAQLVEADRRGEGIGAYGLAIALPQLVLLPLGPWIAEHAGFWVVFAISGLPLFGVPPVWRLARAIHGEPPDVLHPGPDEGAATPGTRAGFPAYRPLLRPMLLLLSVTLAGGAVVTFTPQMVGSALVTTLGLFVMGLVTAVTRWRAGIVADRHGAERFLWPLVLVTAVGMAVTALAVTDHEHTRLALFFVGMVVVGVAYGSLQNLTLVISFNAVHPRHHNLASATWNIGFDAGTGLGSVAVGALAVQSSFTVGLLVAGAVSVVVLPIALRHPSQ